MKPGFTLSGLGSTFTKPGFEETLLQGALRLKRSAGHHIIEIGLHIVKARIHIAGAGFHILKPGFTLSGLGSTFAKPGSDEMLLQ